MPKDSDVVVRNNGRATFDEAQPLIARLRSSSSRSQVSRGETACFLSVGKQLLCNAVESFHHNDALLQTRKLTGDSSRKGLPWVSREPQYTDSGASASISSTTKPITQVRQSKTKRSTKHPFDIKKKVHIVVLKKSQYSHLVSNNQRAIVPREVLQSPIVYRNTDEPSRKEVAPLWLHPFSIED
jgi:hypothetical protein|mmetsp:Transcript_8305/g.10515  ORF Transcript_8305/g.10515 Transcript_8305/m.10515 type:complete len:184 (-) Transcript_8305:16-567(-)|eukprot:scaffold1163_cov193-Alexandrium_tamarense.AAC.6